MAGGVAFRGTEATAFVWTASVVSIPGPAYQSAQITLEVHESAGVCERISQKAILANGTGLSVWIGAGSADPIGPGTYAWGGVAAPGETISMRASLGSTDGTCQTDLRLEATGGSVTLTQVAADTVAGSLDLTLSDGSRLTGVFEAPRCAAALPGYSPGAPAWTCLAR